MSISIFLPVRKGSVRVANKNTRRFANYEGGLLELKLHQLAKTKSVDEIVLSSNDDTALEIAEGFKKKDSRFKIDVRPEELATSTTDLKDLIAHVPQITLCDHVLWTHVTSPFCDEKIYEKSINVYLDKLRETFDSLVSVRNFQNFLWDKELNDIINREGTLRWPNTQDLKKLYEINNAVFLAPRSTFIKKKDRLGTRPFLYEMSKIASLDIDEEEDFTIAEAVYGKIQR